MNTTKKINGGCLCGKVRFTVNSSATTHTVICHCETCRKNAASPVVAWLTFKLKELIFTQDKPKEFRSSNCVIRSFCSTCGTPISYFHSDRPTEIDITTCSLDEPEMFPPTHHSWLEDDLSWIQFDDKLPKHQRTRSESAD